MFLFSFNHVVDNSLWSLVFVLHQERERITIAISYYVRTPRAGYCKLLTTCFHWAILIHPEYCLNIKVYDEFWYFTYKDYKINLLILVLPVSWKHSFEKWCVGKIVVLSGKVSLWLQMFVIRAEITFFYFSFLYFTSKISNPPVLFDGELLQIND